METKDEILDKENDISRIKRKLNRKKSDIQEVIRHVIIRVIHGLGLQVFYSMSNFGLVTWFSGLLLASKLRKKYITEIGREQP